MPEQIKKNTVYDNNVLTFDYLRWRKPLENTNSIMDVKQVVEDIKKTFVSEKNENTSAEIIKELENINIILESIDNNVENFRKQKSEDDKRAFIKKIIEERQDPFGALRNIHDEKIVEQVLKIILRDNDIKRLLNLFLAIENSDDKAMRLKIIFNQTRDNALRKYLDDFLSGFNDLRKEPENIGNA
jgi:hypothetical protein